MATRGGASESPGDRCPRQGQPPCGACKFLRRKCTAGCVFAPHFGSEQGAARFAAVHKVFGASNVSRLLSRVPLGRRDDAVVTVCYEAQARIADPVYGCVSAILALQHQVAALQAELSIVQSQLINSRLAFASTHAHSQQLQPAFSNSSSSAAPNHSANFAAALPSSSALDLADSDPSSSQGLDHEEERKDPIAFANRFLHHPK
ncbi:LOB domain-containing protein 20 [Typha angustifolia]|uniref:LOB domain-containing protein 20 n=1 Tax=Typha angustifolia TaxID=59011 RepID=UPI003C2EDB50